MKLLIFFAALIFLTFKTFPLTFFQQDEWGSFGNFLYRESVGGIRKVFIDSLLAAGKVHVNPIMEMLWYFQFKLFGTNFPGYAYVSLTLHFINTLLVYSLAKLLIKNKPLSILVAVLFAVNSISHQAVSWVSGSLQTQGAALFSLLFAVLFLKYLRLKKKRQKWFYLALLSVFTALMFKETALPFFLLPVFLVFYSKEKSLIAFKKILVPVGMALMVYLILRVVIFINAPPIVLGLTEVLEQPSPAVHIYRLISLPFKALPESIFPTEWLLNFSRTIIRLAYPQFITSDGMPNPYLVETAGLDLVNYVLSIIILGIFYACYRFFKRQKKDELALALLASLVIIIGSTLLVIFIPGKAGYVSIIEPRHLYGATIGSSLFIMVGFFALFSFLTKKTTTVLFLTTVFVLPLIFLHIKLVQRDLAVLKTRSDLRKSFLMTVKNYYPALPPKAIFYVESDQAYYGLPPEEKNLPIQSGFGRMLMVWYQGTEKFPGCFYKDVFLHDLIAQGYQYCDGRGFGYFRQYDKLKESLKKNNLSTDEVFAFSWKGKTEEFENITEQIRGKLRHE